MIIAPFGAFIVLVYYFLIFILNVLLIELVNKKGDYMKKTKTLFEQLKDRANQLSAGEAIIVLDEINKKEGFENAVIFLNSRMKHIREAILKDTFTLQGCRNVNQELASELIARVQQEHLLTTIQATTTNNEATP
ncbi:TPA: hypothetical protein MBN31_005902, partial [Klebsiella pneumoniae]|nr:hypothetical protein [Klebsiella pneumoniae]